MRLAGRAGTSSFLRGLTVLLSFGVIGVLATASSTACIPDPKGDYDDFKTRTANLPQDKPVDAVDASFDSKPPETAVEALYIGICVTSLAARDPEQALRFYTETKYVPDGAGAATGKLTLSVTPMVGWDIPGNKYITPASVSKTETRGTPIVIKDVPVDASGRFTANLGEVNLAQETNSVSGRAAVISDAILDGLYGAGDRFCSTLAGLLTVPYTSVFDPKQNTCLFTKATEGSAVPKIPVTEFACNVQ